MQELGLVTYSTKRWPSKEHRYGCIFSKLIIIESDYSTYKELKELATYYCVLYVRSLYLVSIYVRMYNGVRVCTVQLN